MGISDAVRGRGILYRHRGNKQPPTLDGIDITVPRGTIYGLLGPSGCGKTTLLKCIVGQQKPRKGTLRVFGRIPGQSGFFIPGCGVGYMPQELALYLEITIEETLVYFGRLCYLDKDRIEKRISFLLKLLQIPNKKCPVGDLSGGQQRRVSFAAALIHKPPLLILDEPTVGVDPPLRQKIWRHLESLAKADNITIIITTHYVDEARLANVVGLMRDGRLLAEMNPEKLMEKYGAISLEDVFLKLCEKDNELQNNESGYSDQSSPHLMSNVGSLYRRIIDFCNHLKKGYGRSENSPKDVANDAEMAAVPDVPNVVEDTPFIPDTEQNGTQLKNGEKHRTSSSEHHGGTLVPRKPPFSTEAKYAFKRMSTLVAKNFIQLKRNKPTTCFLVVLPCIQAFLFCTCIGDVPAHLSLAVVSEEKGFFGFSKGLLDYIDPDKIDQVRFSNMSDAVKSVQRGETWGVLHIGPGFSYCLMDRILEGSNADNKTLHCSEVKMYMDTTNEQVVLSILFAIMNAFKDFAHDRLTSTYQNPKLAELPLVMGDPIYGEKEPSFNNFVAPGVLLGIVHFMAMALTSMMLVLERKQGLLDRSIVAGVKHYEVILSILFMQFFIMIAQMSAVTIMMFLVFKTPIYGSVVLVVICELCSGFSGMSIGIMISAFCGEEVLAMMVSLGYFIPCLILNGMLWPLESMATYVRYPSYGMPLTLLLDSTRSVLYRGWGITEQRVWNGFMVSLAWTVLPFLLSVILFKYKK